MGSRKDSESPTKGRKLGRDVNAGKETRISEPDPATSTSTGSLVNSPALNSVGQDVCEDGSDLEQAPIVLPLGGSPSAFETVDEESRPPDSGRTNDNNLGVGILTVDNGMFDSAGPVFELNLVADVEKEESTAVVGQAAVKLSSLAGEGINDDFEPRKTADFAMADGESQARNARESNVQKTKLGEVVHAKNSSSGEVPDEGSSWDLLQYQLEEQAQLNDELCGHSFAGVSKFLVLAQETCQSNEANNDELQLTTATKATATKEELEARLLVREEELENLNDNFLGLQGNLETHRRELEHLPAELAACRNSLQSLQKVNVNLTASLNLETDAGRKLEEENEFLTAKNLKLSSELLEQKEMLVSALDKQNLLECNIRDTELCFEQLTEDNLYLSSSLILHKAKLKELEYNHFRSSFPIQNFVPQENEHHTESDANDNADEFPFRSTVTSGVLSRPSLLQKFDDKQPNVSTALKRHLKEIKNMLQSLERSIQRMHPHSTYFATSVCRTGTSQNIKASGSKINLSDIVSEDVDIPMGETSDELYAFTLEQISHLRDAIRQIEWEVRDGAVRMIEEWNPGTILRSYQMKSQALQLKNETIQANIDELAERMPNYQSSISHMQNRFDEIEKDAHSHTQKFSTQMELLQNEIMGRFPISSQESDSCMDVILGAIQKLNKHIASPVCDNCDIGAYILASVDILHDSFDEKNKLLAAALERNEFATALLRRMYSSLCELTYGAHQNIEPSHRDMKDDELLQNLPECYEILIMNLCKLLDERVLLLSRQNELESGLLNRNEEILCLNKRCNTLEKELNDLRCTKTELELILMRKDEVMVVAKQKCLALMGKLEPNRDHDASFTLVECDKVSLMSDSLNNDFFRSLTQLESLINFHSKEYVEAIEQINLSKKYFRESNIFPEMSEENSSLPLPNLISEKLVSRMSELQEQLDILCTSHIKHKIELQILMEHSSRMKGALEASCSELNLKVCELEQSEQKLSSVREKLSIAVAKGKGLLAQRDSLKQSLVEKSNELEKCLYELQCKEASLEEVDAKLKSHFEAHHTNTLESDLSHIQNSASGLRDSILLKDSVIRRIEEILEELDFPKNFRSQDIVEKIELLSKIVSGKFSFILTERESQSDAGFMVMDSVRDDSQAILDSGSDDFKDRYEHLDRKLNDLTEHNIILEQTLVERNNIVEKWEEVLDRVEIPPQLSILEREHKISWLGKMLPDLQKERDALQLKIKNLEDSSTKLKVELEESCKSISKLIVEVVAIRSENDFLSDNLNKLKLDYSETYEKIVQHDVDRANFQRDIESLQEKLAEKVKKTQDFHDMENKIQELLDLFDNLFHDSDLPCGLSGGSSINYLEWLLRKLVDDYAKLVSENTSYKDAEELVSKDTILCTTNGTSEIVSHDKELDLKNMRIELDKTNSHMKSVKEESDEATENFHTLMSEKDEISRKIKLLQEEMIVELEKNKSLLSQLEVMHREKNALQEQLTQEVKNSASTREKLNVAVRKGKGLVQQRDIMRKEIEELNTMIGCLKSENSERVETLESDKKDLVTRLEETEQNLQYSNKTLGKLLKALDGININTELENPDGSDPVLKLEQIGKLNCELQKALASAENESKKSKRAAELLLAELNEVQQMVDNLQEELERLKAAVLESSKQKDASELAKADALLRLEENIFLCSEERKKQIGDLVHLNSNIGQIKKVCFEFSGLLYNAVSKDINILSYMETSMKTIDKQISCTHLPCKNLHPEVNFNFFHDFQELKLHEQSKDYSVSDNLALAVESVLECVKECNGLKENIYEYFSSIDQKASCLLKTMESVSKKFSLQKEQSESLKRDVTKAVLSIKDKENEIQALNRNLSLLYRTCSNLISEIEIGNSQVAGNKLAKKLPSEVDEQGCVDGITISLTDDCIKSLTDKLSELKGTRNYELSELKTRVLELQREVQEKAVYASTVTAELSCQVRDAEAVAKGRSTELDSAKTTIFSLEKKIEEMENDKKSLAQRILELKDLEASSDGLQERIISLTNAVTAKDHEIEVLVEALDEEELQAEDLKTRNKELKNLVDEKIVELKNLEISHEKSLAKHSTTVNKFDELYNLSESLLAEVEKLQSKLQDQESEISFLLQEITRCTNELLASQEDNKKHSSEIYELLKWFDMTVSRFGLSNVHMNGEETQFCLYTDILDKAIASTMAELEDLRTKISQPVISPEPSEIREMRTEPVSGGALTHMRSGRSRFNNDQISISIDNNKNDNVINDEDDDKAHGFKSLTTSCLVPRFSRPITEKFDGMWVSGDRLLMRQPTLRLGVLVYWVALHAFIASFI